MADSFCTKCGTPGAGAFCADCGQPRDPGLVAQSVASPPSVSPMAAVIQGARQRHGLPALLSFFIPSLGQFVKGDVVGGLVVIAGFFVIVLFAFAGAAAFAPIAFLVGWIWQIYDAYTAPDGATKRELKQLGRR